MATQTAADLITDVLYSVGVRRIYAPLGTASTGSPSLSERGVTLTGSTRHKETAAFAAGAEARLTGNLAVCAGSAARVASGACASSAPTEGRGHDGGKS
jgi:pyruvate dehydrogenase (quinone)